jgi:hypothetical protein
MPKDSNTHTVTIEVNPDDLGVSTRHHFLMATDENYRKESLTPPGGYAPGEKGKPADPPSGEPGIDAVTAAAVGTV